MSNCSLDLYEGVIRRLVAQGVTYCEILGYLERLNGASTRGLSVRSILRICSRRHIRTTYHGGISNSVLYQIVLRGHSYGRRTMHGLLVSEGMSVSQAQVGASLRRVAPIQSASRQHNICQMLNPSPYRAERFGEKLHLDQDEKCNNVRHNTYFSNRRV